MDDVCYFESVVAYLSDIMDYKLHDNEVQINVYWTSDFNDAVAEDSSLLRLKLLCEVVVKDSKDLSAFILEAQQCK
jgi:hypothetical protein